MQNLILCQRVDESDEIQTTQPTDGEQGHDSTEGVATDGKEGSDQQGQAASCPGSCHGPEEEGAKEPFFEKSFAAASSVDSKNGKKRTMAKILEALRGNDSPLPLTQEVLKGLASALQEGGYKAGEGYIIEAKLWQIEEAQGNRAGEPDIQRLDDGSHQQESHSILPHQQDGPGGSRCEAHLAVPVPQQLVRAGMPVQSHLRPGGQGGEVQRVEHTSGNDERQETSHESADSENLEVAIRLRGLRTLGPQVRCFINLYHISEPGGPSHRWRIWADGNPMRYWPMRRKRWNRCQQICRSPVQRWTTKETKQWRISCCPRRRSAAGSLS